MDKPRARTSSSIGVIDLQQTRVQRGPRVVLLGGDLGESWY